MLWTFFTQWNSLFLLIVEGNTKPSKMMFSCPLQVSVTGVLVALLKIQSVLHFEIFYVNSDNSINLLQPFV